MALNGSTNEQKIWNFLVSKGLSKAGAAGLMGNLFAESALIPTNLENAYEKKLGYTDAAYTDAVDSGKYTNFVRDSAGYGLAQWTYWSRKEALLAYAKEQKKSIGDLEMQLCFLMRELEGYKTVLATLKSAKTVREASDSVLVNFERPADQSENAKVRRAGYGQGYYDKYAGTEAAKTTAPTVKEAKTVGYSAKDLIAIALAEVGYKEKKTNAQLDTPDANAGSNNWTKFARDLNAAGYYNGNKNGYAWCDCFVDWCFFRMCGSKAKAEAMECQTGDLGAGCTYSMQYYKNAGRLDMNPKEGDQIFFRYSGNSGADHTGIVISVGASQIVTVEGNSGDQVRKNTYARSDKTIVGFGHPRFDVASPAAPAAAPTTQQTASGGLKVGDIVNFKGTKHYTSANATDGKNCEGGRAKVTQIYQPGSAKHPYHLIAVAGGGSTVYGWVDAADIGGDEVAEKSYYTVVSGDSLWSIAQKRLGNGNRWKEIYDLNGLKSSTIVPGQKLRIP